MLAEYLVAVRSRQTSGTTNNSHPRVFSDPTHQPSIEYCDVGMHAMVLIYLYTSTFLFVQYCIFLAPPPPRRPLRHCLSARPGSTSSSLPRGFLFLLSQVVHYSPYFPAELLMCPTCLLDRRLDRRHLVVRSTQEVSRVRLGSRAAGEPSHSPDRHR